MASNKNPWKNPSWGKLEQIEVFEILEKEEIKLREDAIKKIQDEMKKEKIDPYVQVIGEYIIEQVKNNPTAAEKVLGVGKSIAGSIDAMAKEAMKKKVNNRAVLTDREGYAIVNNYFGIQAGQVEKAKQEQPKMVQESNEAKPKKAVNFNVSLKDFM